MLPKIKLPSRGIKQQKKKVKSKKVKKVKKVFDTSVRRIHNINNADATAPNTSINNVTGLSDDAVIALARRHRVRNRGSGAGASLIANTNEGSDTNSVAKHHVTSAAFRKTIAQHGDKGFFSSIFSGMTDGNPLFSAGIGLSLMGLGLSVARKAALQGVIQLERHLTTSLEIQSKDRSYQWVLSWCNAQTKGKSQHIGVETRVQHQGNGVHTTSFDFVPSTGKHYIWYKKHLVQIVREREKMSDLSTGHPFETVKLTVFSRDRSIFTDILNEAEQAALQKEEGRITIYMPMMTDWRPFGRPRPKRPIDSVILDEGISEFLQNDIKEFQRGGAWYKNKGIPHRRGYLLYGSPGSGKTSFIQALAGEMGYSICVLSLNDRGLSDDRLLHLMTDIPPRSIVLLEDIDAVFNQRESSYSVTFSGLLNALDGVTSIDERIVFMTTNHLEKLDPALIRPGRVDAKIFIGDSTPHQQKKMFKTFFPDVTLTVDYKGQERQVREIGNPTIELATDIMTNKVKTDDTFHGANPKNKKTSSQQQDGNENKIDPNEYQRQHSLVDPNALDPELEAKVAAINAANAQERPLEEFINTANTESFTEGLVNRMKAQVVGEELELLDFSEHRNPDGTIRRLGWETVINHVTPAFLDGVEEGKPASLSLVEKRPERTRLEEELKKHRQKALGSLSPQLRERLKTAVDYDYENDAALEAIKDPAQRERAKLELMRKKVEQDLLDEDDKLITELKKRQYFTDVINRRRIAKGLEPIALVDKIPEELNLDDIEFQRVSIETAKIAEPIKPLGVDMDDDAAAGEDHDKTTINKKVEYDPTRKLTITIQEPDEQQQQQEETKQPTNTDIPIVDAASPAVKAAEARFGKGSEQAKYVQHMQDTIDNHKKKQQITPEMWAIQENERLQNEFVRACSEVPLSMAELQSLMLLYKDRPVMCVEGAKKLVEEKKERLAAQKEQQAALANGMPIPQNANGGAKTVQEQMYQSTHQKPGTMQQHAVNSFKANNVNKM